MGEGGNDGSSGKRSAMEGADQSQQRSRRMQGERFKAVLMSLAGRIPPVREALEHGAGSRHVLDLEVGS